MGNQGMEGGKWWECEKSGWECGESWQECGELGWECGESGWESREGYKSKEMNAFIKIQFWLFGMRNS